MPTSPECASLGRTRRHLALLTGVALLAGGLTACRDSGGTSSVTVGKAVDTVGFAALDIAAAKGYFARQGVKVKITQLGGSSVASSALQGGSIQFAAAASLPLLLAREKGLPFMSVASMDYGVPLQFIVSNSYQAKHPFSAGSTPQRRIATLAGSRLAPVSSTDTGFFQLLLARSGMAKHSVKLVRFQSVSAAVAAMKHNKVDGTMGSPPNSLAPVLDGSAKLVLSARDIPEFRSMSYDLLLTTKKFATSHADTARKVVAALGMANDFIIAHPDQALQILAMHFPSYSADVLRRSLGLVTFSPGARQTAAQWDNAVHTYVSAGLVKPTQAREGDAWTNQYTAPGSSTSPSPRESK